MKTIKFIAVAMLAIGALAGVKAEPAAEKLQVHACCGVPLCPGSPGCPVEPPMPPVNNQQ